MNSCKILKRRTLFYLYDKSEIYSFGYLIKKYGFYPRFLPMPVLTDHSAPNFLDKLNHNEIPENRIDFLTHTHLKSSLYKSIKKGRSYIMYPPFLYANKLYSKPLSKLEARWITIFPKHQKQIGHDTTENEYDFNSILKFIEYLKNSFGNTYIRVCLHCHDYQRGIHKVFEDKGVRVVTAGNSMDDNFAFNFLVILRTSKLIYGNQIGSIFLYATLFEIEYKLINSMPVLGLQGYVDRKYVSYLESGRSNLNLTFRQKLIDSFFPTEDSISRLRLSVVLWKNFLSVATLKTLKKKMLNV